MKRLLLIPALCLPLMAGSCEDDATVAARNVSKAADNFEINRRIVFYNGFSDSYMLEIEGLCSMDLNKAGTAFNVICKTGRDNYKRHTLVLADNATAFVEQIEPAKVSAYHYRVTFKPQSILPDVDFRGSAEALTTNSSELMQ
ncbi:hypothetical protein [Paracoccus sp. (in: a-proteobacteria)]|uniref:beta-sandwich lipoprotein n=1 Tax=Paracoccus sp. TaxID=267 RepID=UPI002897843B|nr:hypothetical protein [Paracoccus sp. (in: a-proteobacteria)]